MGLGRVLFAGGCGQHPRLCEQPSDFFKSAEVYDSLTDEWSPISDMPTRRHGASACRLGSKVFVLGGAYVDDSTDVPDEEKFCDVLDVDSEQWSSLPSADYRHLRDAGLFQRAAFFGAGAVAGRVVALLDGNTIAYNPLSADGWRRVETPKESSVRVGHSSCSATYEGELIVASGRPHRFGKSVAAFRFSKDASASDWWQGSWRQLPDLQASRVGGAMAVVHGRLYITGGVDESTGVFCSDAERLDGESWVRVPWFKMPRALHAHDSYALPYLHR
eukprot:TRINITY_DN54754_c0_g1_i1.p1 TRINITY_DN54754_c0_g1~~TRINITY_DN54754_c0_g1_i1.p1  ORF type:complete len:311 (-),score=58.42 TRINITY_DN54754_c0_g1_i1:48-872(-)